MFLIPVGGTGLVANDLILQHIVLGYMVPVELIKWTDIWKLTLKSVTQVTSHQTIFPKKIKGLQAFLIKIFQSYESYELEKTVWWLVTLVSVFRVNFQMSGHVDCKH